jgi:hypothetical protein
MNKRTKERDNALLARLCYAGFTFAAVYDCIENNQAPEHTLVKLSRQRIHTTISTPTVDSSSVCETDAQSG